MILILKSIQHELHGGAVVIAAASQQGTAGHLGPFCVEFEYSLDACVGFPPQSRDRPGDILVTCPGCILTLTQCWYQLPPTCNPVQEQQM